MPIYMALARVAVGLWNLYFLLFRNGFGLIRARAL